MHSMTALVMVNPMGEGIVRGTNGYPFESVDRAWPGISLLGSHFYLLWWEYSVPSMVRIEEPRFPIFVCTKNMHPDLQIQLDRTAKLSLAEQIRASISRAIESGLLAPGTRLPSWQDLAAQLGVARGTVQAAYERLSDAQMIETFGAGGTPRSPRACRSAARAQRAPAGARLM